MNEPTLLEATSDRGDRVWFLAAEIEGPGFEGLGSVAVWATARDRQPIEAVNHLARVFSTWGPDSPLYALDYEEDALTAAVDCVENSLRASGRSRFATEAACGDHEGAYQ